MSTLCQVCINKKVSDNLLSTLLHQVCIKEKILDKALYVKCTSKIKLLFEHFISSVHQKENYFLSTLCLVCISKTLQHCMSLV